MPEPPPRDKQKNPLVVLIEKAAGGKVRKRFRLPGQLRSAADLATELTKQFYDPCGPIWKGFVSHTICRCVCHHHARHHLCPHLESDNPAML